MYMRMYVRICKLIECNVLRRATSKQCNRLHSLYLVPATDQLECLARPSARPRLAVASSIIKGSAHMLGPRDTPQEAFRHMTFPPLATTALSRASSSFIATAIEHLPEGSFLTRMPSMKTRSGQSEYPRARHSMILSRICSPPTFILATTMGSSSIHAGLHTDF